MPNNSFHVGLGVALWFFAGTVAGAAPGQDFGSGTAPRKPASDPMGKLAERASFHLDFEGTAQAVEGAGELAPTSVRLERAGNPDAKNLDDYFVPGVAGQGLSCLYDSRSVWLQYAAPENVNLRAGSILCWIEYEEESGADTAWFGFQVPGIMSFTVGHAKDTVSTTLLFYGAKGEHWNNAYAVFAHPALWKLNEWHQVCLTWSPADVRFYEDGHLLCKEPLRHAVSENTAKLFQVVLGGWSGPKHDVAAVDELYIFPFPLTEELIRSAKVTARE